MDRKFNKESKTECLLPPVRPTAFHLPMLRIVAIPGNDNKLTKKGSSREVYILVKDNLLFEKDKC